jgi:hypothetical protein
VVELGLSLLFGKKIGMGWHRVWRYSEEKTFLYLIGTVLL